jgi:hypothetical protein
MNIANNLTRLSNLVKLLANITLSPHFEDRPTRILAAAARLIAHYGYDKTPQGGQIANIFSHSLVPLKHNPLMCALYTRDSRVLGDFIRRQDAQRYAGRFMFEKTFINGMQSAGLLCSDITPEVMARLFGILTLGFIHMNALLPSNETLSLDDSVIGLIHLIQCGLAGQDGDSQLGKQAIHQMIAYLMAQYEQVK